MSRDTATCAAIDRTHAGTSQARKSLAAKKRVGQEDDREGDEGRWWLLLWVAWAHPSHPPAPWDWAALLGSCWGAV